METGRVDFYPVTQIRISSFFDLLFISRRRNLNSATFM